MSSGKIILITLLAGLFSVGAGILGHNYFNQPSTPHDAESLVPQPLRALSNLPEFSLPDTAGNIQSSSQWQGKVLVVNFWATWCPPCRKEMPAFIELQQELGDQGLQFIGIAIDEAAVTTTFSEQIGVNYPILIGDESSIDLSRRLGNRFQGLPFSVIADRQGRILHTQAGELSPKTIRQQIANYL
jgi:thiol-disulfide isomerase/thioredoxin